MKKFIFLSSISCFSVIVFFSGNAQTVFWSENFNNGCTQNCLASAYNGWTVTSSGTNGNYANEWFISCAENGEPVGSCGAGCGSNATLHLGSVPCTLCFFCPSGDCGAAYNAGPTFAGEDPTTNKRASTPDINTTGYSNITLSFKYMERGEGASDDASLYYSTNSGSTWTLLTNTAKTALTCNPQGIWTAFSTVLPAACENITTLRIAFNWTNNSNGSGNDPSFAVDDMELSVPANPAPVADFTTALTAFCDSTCINFTDLSANNPSSWSWSFAGAVPATSSQQNPTNICYNVPGTYDVTLIASNANGSDTITKTGYITVNPCFIPVVAFVASDTFFCEKKCISFTDLSTNNPTSWSWSFPGASPDTSTLQHPPLICYNTYGSYTVTLTASNALGTDSATYVTYITVNQNPPVPNISVSGDTLTSSPATAYQWYFNNNPLPGATSQSHVAVQSGNYYVIVSDTNGCQTASNAIFHSVTGIENMLAPLGILISPNPFSSRLVIEFENGMPADLKISLYDVMGKKILHAYKALKSALTIDGSHLAAGVYHLKIETGTLQAQIKILKQE